MPKAPKPYHINKQCNKWEEENHLKQMERKINNAKSTIPAAARAPPSVPRKKLPKPGSQPSASNTPRAQTADTYNNYYGSPLGHQVHLDVAHLDDLISRRLMELLKQPIVQQSIQKDASVVQAKQQQEQLRRLAEAARRVTKPSSAPCQAR